MQYSGYLAALFALGVLNGVLICKLRKAKMHHAALKRIYFMALDNIEEYAKKNHKLERSLTIRTNALKKYKKIEYIKNRILYEARHWKSLYIWERKSKEHAVETYLRSEALRFRAEGRNKKICRSIAAHARHLDRRAMARKWIQRMGRISIAKGASGPWNVRFKAIEREFKELREAMYHGSKSEYIDALGDIAYAVEVSFNILEVDGNEVFKRIHDSNMTKDPYLFSKDGKGKGLSFKSPVLEDLVNADKADS